MSKNKIKDGEKKGKDDGETQNWTEVEQLDHVMAAINLKESRIS